MNNLKKKKKGFTLIELMAVIAIIAILAAVLVPTVSGYINRAKKTAIITQVRNVISAVETFNATANNAQQITEGGEITNDPTLSDIRTKVGEDLLDIKSVSKLPTTTPLRVMKEINSDTNSIKDITVDNDGVLESYTKPNTATTGQPTNGYTWTKAPDDAPATN